MAPWARGGFWVRLNTTISAFCVRRKQAQKMAMLKVFPKRRGVLINTSPGHELQPCFCMMAGFCTPQSSLYMTRAEALKKFSWNSS